MSDIRDVGVEKKNNDSIKKGLLRIKEAQIEVLRQLRKDDVDLSRNVSLEYSKETNYDPKQFSLTDRGGFQFGTKGQLPIIVSEFSAKEIRVPTDPLQMANELRKYKEAAQKAEAKMKEYEESEEKALSRAQKAYSNAIESQKKYIALKSDYEKLTKEKERLWTDLRKLQKKQLMNLNQVSDNDKVPSKIISELISSIDCFKNIVEKVSSHKCPRGSSQESKNQSVSSSNSLNLSTFEVQKSFDKHIGKLIAYFTYLQTLGPFQQNLQNASSGVFGLQNSSHYLSNSFKEDIRLIEEEMRWPSNNRNDLEDSEMANLEMKIQKLQKQNEQLRLLKSEFENFKIKAKENELKKELEIEIWKKKLRIVEQLSISKKSDSQYDRNSSKNSLQLLEDRLMELEKENNKLTQKLKRMEEKEKNYVHTIEKLKFDLEMTNATNATKQENDGNDQSYETRQPNFSKNSFSSPNLRTLPEYEQMLETIKKLQTEKENWEHKEKQMISQYEQLKQQMTETVQQKEQELQNVMKQYNDSAFRKQNSYPQQFVQSQEQQPQPITQSYNLQNYRVRTEEAQRRNSFGFQNQVNRQVREQPNQIRYIQNAFEVEGAENIYRPMSDRQHLQSVPSAHWSAPVPNVQNVQSFDCNGYAVRYSAPFEQYNRNYAVHLQPTVFR